MLTQSALVLALLGCIVAFADAKPIKIHGYVTAITSGNEFEIDEYRITKDATVTLEFEKSDDPDEQISFKPEDIRVGTEMEISGDLNDSSGQLIAKTIKVHLTEHQRIKRTALIELAPPLKKSATGWEGEIRAKYCVDCNENNYSATG